MPIPFEDEKDFSGLKSAPYSFSKGDKVAADSILDPLVRGRQVGKVPPNEICPIAAPGFVVWRNEKPHFVVDLCKIILKLIRHRLGRESSSSSPSSSEI
jgi:hypothetical protein